MDTFPIPDNITELLTDNATYRAMGNSMQWGDLVPLTQTTMLRTPPPEDQEPEHPHIQSYDEDDGWEMPDLTRREHIWNSFPVISVPLGRDATGAERHSIQWHLKNLMTGRNEYCFDDYVETTQRRLLKALNASAKWDVLDAETDEWVQPDKTNPALYPIQKEICIIRMVFLRSEPVTEDTMTHALPTSQESETTHSSSGPKPILKKLNDIKFYFPVVWKEQESINGNKIYNLEIHRSNAANQAKMRGISVATLTADLMAALKISPSWRVLAPTGSELCRLELEPKC
jgi:hypothetical protein